MAAAGPAPRPTPADVAESILGGVEPALPSPRVVLAEFIDLTKTKPLRKSDRQPHLWRLPQERAVANFEKALAKRADWGIDKITREDMLASRNR